MVSPVLYEHFYDGAFLISEEEAHRSRDLGTITNGGGSDLPLDGGLILAAVAGAVTAAARPSGNTGNGTIGSLSAGVGAQIGTYQVRFTAATTFNVYDTTGAQLSTGSTGTAFLDEIGFTITAGATAFVAGDAFMVTVAKGGWTPYTASTPPVGLGILYNRTVITAGTTKKVTVVARQAQVNQAELVWDPSVGQYGSITSAAGGSNVGNGTIGSLSIVYAQEVGGVDAVIPAGVYTLTAESALAFQVVDPTGLELAPAAVGAAYSDGGIAFTITAGGTPFAEGDTFTITVTESGQAQALQALAAAGIVAR